jgi:hypothetical protein
MKRTLSKPKYFQSPHVVIGLILGIVLLVLAGYYFYLNLKTLYTSTKETSYVVDIVASKEPSFDREFTLKKGESITLGEDNVSIKLTGFINSPCPKGAQCIWSGLSVLYDIIVDGVTYTGSDRSVLDIPYVITIKDSDYESFAVFVISKK